MANRIPLIVNPTASQIQELPTDDHLQLNDSNKLKLGTDREMLIFHDSTGNSIIQHSPPSSGTGDEDLRLKIAGNQFVLEKATGKNFMTASHNDYTEHANEVSLFYADNATSDDVNRKLSTKIDGVDINGKLRVSDDIIAFDSSDATLKENLVPIPNAVDKVGIITGYTYKWKTEGTDYASVHGTEDTGVIAQQIEALGLPGITTTRENGIKAISYKRLIPILIEAIKELDTRLKTLEG